MTFLDAVNTVLDSGRVSPDDPREHLPWIRPVSWRGSGQAVSVYENRFHFRWVATSPWHPHTDTVLEQWEPVEPEDVRKELDDVR